MFVLRATAPVILACIFMLGLVTSYKVKDDSKFIVGYLTGIIVALFVVAARALTE